MRILVLDNRGYPGDFNSHPIIIANPSFDIEKKIIERLNEYNPKLELEEIIYRNIKTDFGIIDSGKFFGLIIDTQRTNDSDINVENSIVINNDKYTYSVFAYVFMSSNEENTRTALFSQKIFPELIEIIPKTQESQTFQFSDKPIYLINMIDKTMTSPFILFEIEMMMFAEINIVNVFQTSLERSDISHDMKQFASKISGYNLENIFDYDDIEGKFTLKLSNLEAGIHRQNNRYVFKGSHEKFYWLGALCLTKFAFELNLKLDLSEISIFRSRYHNEIGTSTKFTRTDILFKYLEKLAEGRRYFNV